MAWMAELVGVPTIGVSSGCGNAVGLDACITLHGTAAVAVRINNRKRCWLSCNIHQTASFGGGVDSLKERIVSRYLI